MASFVDLPYAGAHRVTGAELNAAFANLTPTTVKMGTPGWLEAIIGATESNTEFCTLSPTGRGAAAFATRTSDSTSTGSFGTWSLGLFAINDNTTQIKPAYTLYSEVRRLSGAGAVENAEFVAVNLGAAVPVTPFTGPATGQSFNLLLGAGRPDVASNNTSAAIGIGGGGQTSSASAHGSGVVFFGNSVANEPGTYGLPLAVDMPRLYTLAWRNGQDGTVGAYVRSDVITNGQRPGLIFQDGGLRIKTGDAYDRIVLNNGSILLDGLVTLTTSVTTGAATVGGTFGVTGLLTATSGITAGLVTAANDAAAATGGVPLNGLYNLSDGTVKRRLA